MTTAEILILAGVTREQLGRRLRELWTADRRRHPGPIPPSHVAPWEDLSPADQEVDMAMAEDLFAAGWTARFAAGHPQPCHCLCSVSHPQAPGICDALNAAVERTVQLRTFALTVLLCKPCAAAAGGYRAGLAQLADEAPGRTRET